MASTDTQNKPFTQADLDQLPEAQLKDGPLFQNDDWGCYLMVRDLRGRAWMTGYIDGKLYKRRLSSYV